MKTLVFVRNCKDLKIPSITKERFYKMCLKNWYENSKSECSTYKILFESIKKSYKIFYYFNVIQKYRHEIKNLQGKNSVIIKDFQKKLKQVEKVKLIKTLLKSKQILFLQTLDLNQQTLTVQKQEGNWNETVNKLKEALFFSFR